MATPLLGMDVRILVAPQEFKGSLTAREAATAIARGLRRALPSAEIEPLPLADGGSGTVDALVSAVAGRLHETEVQDPLGRPVGAVWGELSMSSAVIEMAAASGLVLLAEDERDPRSTSSYGTGELLLAAMDAGCGRMIVGVGGSATNDGGAGLAQALGVRLLDTDGDDLVPGGAALAGLARIDNSGIDPRVGAARITVAADVTNPLCGTDGASRVYGPQKGASAEVAEQLDRALARYADVIRRDIGLDVANIPGAGAAGGLAAGLIAFCGAELRPGFNVVAEAVGLSDRVQRAEIVIAGEGRLDKQTGFGKTTAGVARMAREAGKRVVAIVGSVERTDNEDALSLFDAVYSMETEDISQDEAMARAEELLAAAAERVGRDLA